MARTQLGKQALFLVGSTALAQVTYALVYLIAARDAPVAEFGAVAAAIALGTAAAGYLDFGTNALWVREVAKGELSLSRLSSLTITKLLIAFFVALIWAVAWLSAAPNSSMWLAGPAGATLLLSQTMQVPLRGAALIERVAISIVADRAVVLVILLTFIAAAAPASISLGIAVITGPAVSGILCHLLTPPGQRIRFKIDKPANPWEGAAGYGVASAAVGSQSLDATILNLTSGGASAGAYAAVGRWLQPFGMLANAFASVSIPHVAKAPSFREGIRIARKSLWLLIMAAAGCLCVIPLAPWAVGTLLGPTYTASIPVLQIMSIGMLAAIANQPLATILQSRGYDKGVSAVIAIGVAIQLTTVAAFAPYMGATAGALGFATMQILLLAVLSMLTARIFRREHPNDRNENHV